MAKLKANKPTADVLMNSMRAMGYSFEAAIADIVDNSVSAQARNIVLRFPIDPSDCCVAVCDDGIGMNKKELLDAMKYGSQLKSANRSEDDLGRFGLGMKAASLSQCRRLTVASKKDGKLSAYIWDLDIIEEKKDWYMVDCSKEQIAEIRYVDFLSDKESGTIDVNQYKNEKYNTIRFSLCDEEIKGLFFKFCDDLIEQSRGISDKGQGYQTIVNRFFQWKKLFVGSKHVFLTEPEIMGLIGEILFLRGKLAEQIGLENALKSWSGQELTHKDFSYGDSWYEVKTIHRGIPAVKISSIEQLESSTDGELVVFFLEKMSAAYNGVNLNKLILETRSLFASDEDRNDFMAKVALQGYVYNDYYDDFIYEIRSCNRYRVTNGFPRLTHELLPEAICKASYEILLQKIEQYKLKDQEAV